MTTINDIYTWPELVSDLVAQTPNASGIYLDSSPNNNNWIQANVAAQPTINNFTLSSGLNANAFYSDGSVNTGIKAYFNPPGWIENINYNIPVPSEITVAVVADIANGAGATQGVLLGGGATGLNQWLVGITSKHPIWYSTGHSSNYNTNMAMTLSPTGGSTPQLFIYSISAVYQQVGFLLNANAGFNTFSFSTEALQCSCPVYDSTLILGGSQAGKSAGWPVSWNGNIYRCMIFKESFLNPAKATKLGQLQSVLRTTYGI